MDLYTVYIHENRINGKKYVGITCLEPEKRWANGKGYSHCRRFNNAIKKYGWDNFEHMIIKEGISKEEAISTEKELIIKYRTQIPEYGYNLTCGGEHFNHNSETKKIMSNRRSMMKGRIPLETRDAISKGLKGNTICRKTVSQYSSSNGELINIYPSLSIAAEAVGAKVCNISLACNGKIKTAGGYIWKYGDNIKQVDCESHATKSFNKPVKQISKDGIVLFEYSSISEASRKTGISASGISSVCLKRKRYKTAGGFIWRFLDDKDLLEDIIQSSKSNIKPVYKIGADGEILSTYSSIHKAAFLNSINASSIVQVCKGRKKTAGGYRWKYVESDV